MPGLIAVGLTAVAVASALFALATGHATAAVVAAVVAVLLLAGGLGWLLRERRRIRRIEADYLRTHPEADAQPPAS